jgi:hypothetical protein
MSLTDYLIDAWAFAMLALQGCGDDKERNPVGIKLNSMNEEQLRRLARELCPLPGDSVVIINCGTHYELSHNHADPLPLCLTEEDIEDLKEGRIIWN